jgi:hypothetical protein
VNLAIDIVTTIVGVIIVFLAAWDGIESLVIPRSVDRRFGITTVFYRITWSLLRFVAARVRKPETKHRLLASYSPLSIVCLIGIWAFGIIFGYAVILVGCHIQYANNPSPTFGDLLYYSGITFFTVGFGDLTPISNLGRFFAVAEAATGFGFLGLLIGFVPVLYGLFSSREAQILLLDSKAGSEPTAFELIRRHSEAEAWPELQALLKQWETLAAGLLENFISFPVLAYYRSQHDGQSWLRSMTAILDACVLIETTFDDTAPGGKALRFQARATYAMCRHAVVDLSYLIGATPDLNGRPRLSSEMAVAMCKQLRAVGAPILCEATSGGRFDELRRTYDPFVITLAEEIMLELPDWKPDSEVVDNWQVSKWEGVRHL